jgi:hypothetical protein
MDTETISFGLLHPTTRHLARCINTDEEVAIFHRLNPERTQTTYASQKEEINDRDCIFEWENLEDLLHFIKTHEWDQWNDEPDIDDDFSDFVPVAFIRGMRRIGGAGDLVDVGMKVRLVTLNDELGKSYDLLEIPQ